MNNQIKQLSSSRNRNTSNSKKSVDKVFNQLKYKQLASKNLNQNGHIYVNILIQAYNEDLISDMDLSDELMLPYEAIPFLVKKIEDDIQ